MIFKKNDTVIYSGNALIQNPCHIISKDSIENRYWIGDSGVKIIWAEAKHLTLQLEEKPNEIQSR